MKDSVFTIARPSYHVSSYTVDEALDIIGRGRFQYYVFISCGIFLMATIVETMGISYILAPATCELELDTFRKGILSSISFLGIAITSHISGFLTDEFGRKRVVFISLTISMGFSVAAALAPGFWTIFVLRLLSGMSISAASSGAYAYLSEFFPTKMRAQFIAFASAVASLSVVYMPIVGIFINRYQLEIPITASYTLSGWRIHMLINVIPGIISLFFMHKLPESPKYLMLVNRAEDSLRVLRTMYEVNTGESRFRFPVQQLKSADDGDHSSDRKSTKSLKGFCSAMVHETKLIFTPPHLCLILSCCFIQFGCFVMGGGCGLWFPELSNRISKGQSNIGICEILSSTQNNLQRTNNTLIQQQLVETKCQVVVNEEMFTYNMVLGAFYMCSFTLLGLGLNKISLKRTLTGLMILGTASALLIQEITDGTLLLGMFCLLIICGGVSVPMVNATAVDLFPTHLRGMAISVTILIGRLGTVVGANSLGFLLEMNCEATFYGIALLLSVCAVIAACLPKKNHKEEL